MQQFDKKYCLNLEHRTDRKQSAEVEFENHGITGVEFVKAVDGSKLGLVSIYKQISPGALGAFKSHLNILKNAYNSNVNSVLIFEDDVRMEEGFDEYFEEQMKHVPDDWDFLYLGWADFKGFKTATGKCINEWVCIPEQPYGLFAYAIRGKKIMSHLIRFFEDRENNIQYQYDEYLAFEFWPFNDYKMYALIPPLIWYKEMGTDIQTNRAVN